MDDAPRGRATAGVASRVRDPGRLVLTGAAVTAAGAATNGLAYLIPLVGARRLAAGDLGALATAMALVAIATVPGLGLQTAVGVRIARIGAADGVGWLAIKTSLVVGGTILAATPLLGTALDLPLVVPALVAATAVPSIMAGRWLGEMQGAERFGPLAAGMLLVAAGRYMGVVGGLLAGVGLVGSMAIGAAIAWLALPPIAHVAGGSGRPLEAPSALRSFAAAGPSLPRHAVAAASAALAMLILTNADLLLARYLFTAADSGAYAVGAVLTKGALWAPQFVTVLALPRLARQEARALRVGVGLVCGCGILLVAAAALLGHLAVAVTGGADYQALADYADLFAGIGGLWALVYLLLNARIALGVRWPAGPLWAATAVLVTGGLVLSPATLGGLAAIALATAGIAVITMGVLLRFDRRSGP